MQRVDLRQGKMRDQKICNNAIAIDQVRDEERWREKMEKKE